MRKWTIVMVWMAIACMNAQNVRETVRLDEGWKFALGNAADPKKDFGCGTEYFNYLMVTRPWAINIPKRVWDGTGR